MGRNCSQISINNCRNGSFVFNRRLSGQDHEELIAAGDQQVKELLLVQGVPQVGTQAFDGEDQEGVDGFKGLLQLLQLLKAQWGLGRQRRDRFGLRGVHGQEQGNGNAVRAGAQRAHGQGVQGRLQRRDIGG